MEHDAWSIAREASAAQAASFSFVLTHLPTMSDDQTIKSWQSEARHVYGKASEGLERAKQTYEIGLR